MTPPARELTTEERLATINRSLPFSDEAEKGVLSCLLQDPGARLDECRDALPPTAFYHHANRTIYEVLLDCADKRIPIDVVTLSQQLRDRGLMDKAGGPGALSELYTFVPIAAHFSHYIGILKEKSCRRRQIDVCTRGITAAYDEQSDLATQLDLLQSEVLAIAIEREERGPEPIGLAAHQVLHLADAAVENIKAGNHITGYELGFSPDADRILNGAESGDRIAICAHPSTGKTALLMNIARHLAIRYQAPGLIFALDDQAVSLARRSIADLADVDITQIRSGIGLMQEEGRRKIARMQDAEKQLGTWPIWLDDRPGLTIQQIAATTRRYVKQHGIQWMAMDFYQNIRCPIKGDENNDVKVLTAVSRQWKDLVNELCKGRTFFSIMLSQLNRDVGKKERPTPHNIKNSSALYEDCSKMILLSNEHRSLDELREEEEDIPTKDKAQMPSLALGERLVIADIAKNKDGPTKPVWVRLLGSRTRFSGLVPDKRIFNAAYNKDHRTADGRA